MPAELTAGIELRPLTPKRLRFAAEYVIDLNGAAAARRAGVADSSAKVTACRWLKEPAVAAEVERLRAEQLEQAGVTAYNVLMETSAIAHANVLDYLPALGLEDSDLAKLTRRQAAAIREIEIEEFDVRPEALKTTLEPQPQGGALQRGSEPDEPKLKLKRRIKLKLAPKTPALELLGKNKSLWAPGGDDEGKGSNNVQVNVIFDL
jgi:Terminase small subunit